MCGSWNFWPMYTSCAKVCVCVWVSEWVKTTYGQCPPFLLGGEQRGSLWTIAWPLTSEDHTHTKRATHTHTWTQIPTHTQICIPTQPASCPAPTDCPARRRRGGESDGRARRQDCFLRPWVWNSLRPFFFLYPRVSQQGNQHPAAEPLFPSQTLPPTVSVWRHGRGGKKSSERSHGLASIPSASPRDLKWSPSRFYFASVWCQPTLGMFYIWMLCVSFNPVNLLLRAQRCYVIKRAWWKMKRLMGSRYCGFKTNWLSVLLFLVQENKSRRSIVNTNQLPHINFILFFSWYFWSVG